MKFILLEEWNSSAVGVILLMFLIPLTLLFFATKWLIRLIPIVKTLMDEAKKDKPVFYASLNIIIFLLSILLAFGLLSLHYLFTGKGLLE